MDFRIRPLEISDRQWVSRFTQEHWGARKVVSRGRVHYPDQLEGFVATREGKRVGLATYDIQEENCELVTLNSLEEGFGIGSTLINAVTKTAVSRGCTRIWLITTNDNLDALRFYQKRGLSLVAIYPNALEESRKLKPEIPLIGNDGIPLRDEIELEMILPPNQGSLT